MSISFIGIVRDHSISMSSIAAAAMADYNVMVRDIRDTAGFEAGNQVIATVVECGTRSTKAFKNAGITSYVDYAHYGVESSMLPLMTKYHTPGGGTPLRDSIFITIKALEEQAKTVTDPDVSFTVLVTTDGHENQSSITEAALKKLINEKQATDRWTFIARVPVGSAKAAARLGIPAGNILEWQTTQRGQEQAAVQTSSALRSFMSSGQKSTTTFFANLSEVSVEEVKASLKDISDEVVWLRVNENQAGMFIRDFVESMTGEPMLRGAAHYALVKKEPKVQDSKRIIIREKATGIVYAGDAARQILGLPRFGTVRLAPEELGEFEVYIQSTSVNRKVDANTRVLYWSEAGVKYKGGKSAQ